MAGRSPEQWEASFVRGYGFYERFAAKLEALLAELLMGAGIVCEPLSTRVKQLASFRSKVLRRSTEADPWSSPLWSLPDLVGLRVVVHFEADVERVAELLRREFIVDELQTRRLSDRRGPLRTRTI